MSERCAAIRDRDGRQCLLVRHADETPHCTVGKGWEYWGGRCQKCGRSVEEAACPCEPVH